MAETPDKIGKYTILGIAGRGNQGIVYIAHDPFVDRKVAIKVCPDADMPDYTQTMTRKMFFNEAQTAGNLDHPNILRVYDAGETETEPYIVMEFVEGAETLRSFISPEKLLPVETVLTYVRQCATALDYAHRRGVTHRDVKPANIMLTEDGGIKLVDFGIAHRAVSDRTQLLGSFGSPRYMSPEQARGDDVGGQSDLFSLGVVLYELLTGKTPFDADNIHGMVYKIVNEPPRPIREHRVDLPEALIAVVERTLRKALDERYPTGADLASDLGRILDDLNRPEAELPDERKFELLRPLAFFEGFADAEIEEVLAQGRWENYAGGETVIREGDGDRSLFILVSGEVSVTKRGRPIAVLPPGVCFGEIGFLEGISRTASVVAGGRIAVLEIAAPVKEWASLPCQLRFNRILQRTLIDRLCATSSELAASRPDREC